MAVSQRIREVLIEDGVAPERGEVVYSGLELTRRKRADGAEWRRRLGVRSDSFLVGNVASLAPHKAQIYLLQTATKVSGFYPEARFVIVGEGGLGGRLKRI